MTAELIDCQRIAAGLLGPAEQSLARIREADLSVGLAALVIGDDATAAADQSRLERISSELGITCEAVSAAESVSQADLLEIVRSLNQDPAINAIVLLGAPPPHIDEHALRSAVDSAKDVDAATPENIGLLAMGRPRYQPSTAAAAYEVLDAWIARHEYDVEDFYRRTRIVVVGGTNADATAAVLLGCARRSPVASVDPTASGTPQFGWYTRHADVLIVAAGVPALIRAEHVRDGAIVIDAGGTPIRDGDTGAIRIVGDVVVSEVLERAGAVTPDPGEFAKVRVAALIGNVARAALAAAAARDVDVVSNLS